jgi:hypothetical protein
MSTILLERPPDQPLLPEPNQDISPTPPGETIEPAMEAAAVPLGITALEGLEITEVAPPIQSIEGETQEREKSKREGISERTVADLHTILSDDPDPEPKAAARQRLEKGTITERALAFSLDVIEGSKYDNTIYEDFPPPDTRSTAGVRSRRLAIEDPQNSFLAKAEKAKYSYHRKLSDRVHSSIHNLAYHAEQAQKDPKGEEYQRYRSDNIGAAATHFVLKVADRLDAETVYKLLGHNRSKRHQSFSRDLANDDGRLLKTFTVLLDKSEGPSAADAFLTQQLFYANSDLTKHLEGHSVSYGGADKVPEGESRRQLLERQRKIQDVLARVNQTHDYTVNELSAVGTKDKLSDEEFQILHRLRHKLPNWSSAEDIPIYKKYIIDKPDALKIIDEANDTDTLHLLRSVIHTSLGLGGKIEEQSPEKIPAAHEAYDKLIDFLGEVPDPDQREKIIQDVWSIHHGTLTEGKEDQLTFAPEKLTWIIENAPQLLMDGNVSVIARGLKGGFDIRNTRGEEHDRGREWQLTQEVLQAMNGLPAEGRAYQFLLQQISDTYKSLGAFNEVESGGGRSMIERIQRLDQASPTWLGESKNGTDLFDSIAPLFIDSANGDEYEAARNSLESFLSEISSYDDLTGPMKELAQEMIGATRLKDNYEPITSLFKPENRDVLKLFMTMNLGTYYMRGFGTLNERMEELRPVAKQLEQHPLMSILGTEEAKGIGPIVKDLLTADEPLKYADALYQSTKLFGQNSSETLVDMLYAVYRGGKALEVQDESLRKIVGEGGQPGIDKLNATLSKFRDRVIAGDIDVELLENSHTHRAYFKALTRYDVSQFGGMQYDDKLLLLLKQDSERREQGDDRDRLIDDAYQPSGILNIAEKDQEKAEKFEISPDGVLEWQEFTADLKDGIDIATDKPERLGEVVSELLATLQVHQARLQKGKEALTEKLATIPEGKQAKLQKKLEELELEIAELSEIDEAAIMNPTFFLRNVSVIGKYKDTHSSIRKVLFATTLIKAPQELERAKRLSGIAQPPNGQRVAKSDQTKERPARKILEEQGNVIPPKLEDLEAFADLVQHVTNQETWGQVFNNFGLYKSLDQILNINAMDENIRRGLNIDTAGTREMQFMPSRGLLLELSAYLADTCWNNEAGRIANENPNITGVIIKQNEGTKDARFAGAGLLIEGKSDKGEPVLIIRGLNPIENVIQKLDAKDFFTKFTDYARGIAEKRGMKLAVVIDKRGAGGATTNRKPIYEYLDSQIKPQAQQVILADEPNTHFNNYDIEEDTYLI